MYPDPEEFLNKRSEIMSGCPHERKYLLSNYDSKDWLIAYKVYFKCMSLS